MSWWKWLLRRRTGVVVSPAPARAGRTRLDWLGGNRVYSLAADTRARPLGQATRTRRLGGTLTEEL